MGDTQYRSEEDYEYSGSATLVAPHFGLKFRLSSHTLRPYVSADLFKVFPFVTVKSEETTRFYEDGNLVDTHRDVGDTEEDEELVEDILGVWGFNVGFGAEYFFSENFSIGGEYVFRWFATSLDEEGEEEYGGGSGYESGRTWNDELSASLKMSHAAIVLSYYF